MKDLRRLVAIFSLIPVLTLMVSLPSSLFAQEHTTTHQETSHSTGQETHADSTAATHEGEAHAAAPAVERTIAG